MGPPDHHARIGTTLRGKWKLEKLLGVGGMAAVYVASHKIGRSAAIKLLHPEVAFDARVRERFEQEAMAVNSIGHPGVVEIIDIDETEDGSAFLVMELLDGETLADQAERIGKLETKPLLALVDQLLDVLVACHRKGIIHRDIKPENLFIQRSGKLKVLDFGIARMREGVRTVAGTMLGTVAFMPPEQLKGHDVDARADLFGVGATMFTVLTGRRIHLAKNDTELAMKMLTKPAPALASVLDGIDENVAMVVDRALAFLPKRRYPDAQTMRGDVWGLQRGGRPPYANACEQAGQNPRVVELPTDAGTPAAKAAKPAVRAAELPATDPQMPAFLASGVASTDPQMPVFGDDELRGPLPSTQPELPAFFKDASGASKGDGGQDANAEDAPDDDGDAKRPQASEPSTEQEPRDGPHKTDKGWPAAPSKPPRAAAVATKPAAEPADDKEDDAGAVEDDAPSQRSPAPAEAIAPEDDGDGDDDSSSSDAPPSEDAPDDKAPSSSDAPPSSDAPDDKAPSSSDAPTSEDAPDDKAPSSSDAPSSEDAPDDKAPSSSDAPPSSDAPASSGREVPSKIAPDAPADRGLGGTVLFFLIGVAAVLAIAWWAGLLP